MQAWLVYTYTHFRVYLKLLKNPATKTFSPEFLLIWKGTRDKNLLSSTKQATSPVLDFFLIDFDFLWALPSSWSKSFENSGFYLSYQKNESFISHFSSPSNPSRLKSLLYLISSCLHSKTLFVWLSPREIQTRHPRDKKLFLFA